MLIDSHCHLDHLELDDRPGGLDAVLAAARERGVERFLCVGTSADNRTEVLGIADRYADVVASVGIHPLNVERGPVGEAELLAWARHPAVVALGETGLDYHYGDSASQPLQRQSFITHLQAAAAASLPLIVHTREARRDTLELIAEYGNQACAGVLHCFTEDWATAARAMDMNYLISISGIVTFRNASALRDVVRRIPLERLMLETDSPYLAPVPHRGKANEPQYVREVAEFVADLKGVSYAELVARTAQNFFRLFRRAAA